MAINQDSRRIANGHARATPGIPRAPLGILQRSFINCSRIPLQTLSSPPLPRCRLGCIPFNDIWRLWAREDASETRGFSVAAGLGKQTQHQKTETERKTERETEREKERQGSSNIETKRVGFSYLDVSLGPRNTNHITMPYFFQSPSLPPSPLLLHSSIDLFKFQGSDVDYWGKYSTPQSMPSHSAKFAPAGRYSIAANLARIAANDSNWIPFDVCLGGGGRGRW